MPNTTLPIIYIEGKFYEQIITYLTFRHLGIRFTHYGSRHRLDVCGKFHIRNALAGSLLF